MSRSYEEILENAAEWAREVVKLTNALIKEGVPVGEARFLAQLEVREGRKELGRGWLR